MPNRVAGGALTPSHYAVWQEVEKAALFRVYVATGLRLRLSVT